jgi:GT2 family glycosyltransferase
VKLSVVISTLGNYTVLQRVLDGFSQQSAAPDVFEVLVVKDRNDPRADEIERAIGTRAYDVRQLTGAIPGLSSNRNVGWRAARAPIVLFTDNDTIPAPDLVREHLAWHEDSPAEEVAVVGHVRWAPELDVTPFMRWLEEGIQFDFGSISGAEASWAHLYGANSSLKRAFIERVGGYDEHRVPYLYDDLDFGYRAHQLGLRVRYNRRAIVNHFRPGMTVEFWKDKVRRVAAAERQFVTVHPELDPPLYQRFKAVEGGSLRGRSVRVARFVPEWIPWLGPQVWARVRLTFLQELAPHFLAGWEEAATRQPSAEWLARSAEGGRQPPGSAAGSEPASRPCGSWPGGPK